MPKSSQYWKEYNAKRKPYLSQKKREARIRQKSVLSTTKELKVVDISRVVDKVVDSYLVVDTVPVVDKQAVVDNHPKLAKLIKQYQTGTNYSCTFNCSLNKYCSNCWYFIKGEFVDYKEETCLK